MINGMWDLTDLAALMTAMKNGVLEVEYPSGQRVKYQSLDALRDLRGDMIRDINAGNGGKSPALARLDTGV